eukprot:3509177-Lingulodinium_polyedra.AAC.1
MVVARGCYCRHPEWLRTGFELWREIAPFARDYMLPRADVEGRTVSRHPATYSDATAAGRALLE